MVCRPTTTRARRLAVVVKAVVDGSGLNANKSSPVHDNQIDQLCRFIAQSSAEKNFSLRG